MTAFSPRPVGISRTVRCKCGREEHAFEAFRFALSPRRADPSGELSVNLDLCTACVKRVVQFLGAL